MKRIWFTLLEVKSKKLGPRRRRLALLPDHRSGRGDYVGGPSERLHSGRPY